MRLPYAKLDSILWSWAANSNPIQDFTITNVLQAAKLDPKFYGEVLGYILRKRDYWVVAYQVSLCANSHKGERFPLEQTPDLDETFDCWCGDEYCYDPDHSFLAFSFTDDFREEAIFEKKKISL